MPTPQHKPLAVLPGRTAVAIHCFEYLDSDVGPYNEISLSIATTVKGKKTIGAHTVLLAFASGVFHGFVADLPVTTELALHGGLDYYNFPKYLANIEFTENEDARICRLLDAESKALILEFRGKKGPTTGLISRGLRGRTLTFLSYPVMNGEILRAEVRIRIIDAALLRGGDLELSLQDHPNAEPYRRLRLSKPLKLLFAPRCEALLFLPNEWSQVL